MKKSLIALAALAAAGVASAQSSVTLFGIVDVGVSHYSVAGGARQTALSNSGYNSARLGFRGTEDLGGGMSASFWLEGDVSPDDGGATALSFGRRSTLSLAGSWGELRLGRDYTPTFLNDSAFDPFGTNGVGTNLIMRARATSASATPATAVGTLAAPAVPGAFSVNNSTIVRSSNSVGYFLPANLGGFYGQAMYAFHEQTTAAAGSGGRYLGGRIGYAQGPFNVAAAYGRRDGANPPTAASPEVRTYNLGGSWDFGVAKLMGEYSRDRIEQSATASNTLKGWLIGGLIPMGAGEIRLAYSRVKLDTAGNDPRAAKIALGYVHNLSKRTALYATYARISNRDGASLTVGGAPAGVANASSRGYDVGIRHSF
jgi:predicted porin